jgi:hypothetical protein
MNVTLDASGNVVDRNTQHQLIPLHDHFGTRVPVTMTCHHCLDRTEYGSLDFRPQTPVH